MLIIWIETSRSLVLPVMAKLWNWPAASFLNRMPETASTARGHNCSRVPKWPNIPSEFEPQPKSAPAWFWKLPKKNALELIRDWVNKIYLLVFEIFSHKLQRLLFDCRLGQSAIASHVLFAEVFDLFFEDSLDLVFFFLLLFSRQVLLRLFLLFLRPCLLDYQWLASHALQFPFALKHFD